jgi:hypothetical protein
MIHTPAQFGDVAGTEAMWANGDIWPNQSGQLSVSASTQTMPLPTTGKAPTAVTARGAQPRANTAAPRDSSATDCALQHQPHVETKQCPSRDLRPCEGRGLAGRHESHGVSLP